jgi:hypothetical protein
MQKQHGETAAFLLHWEIMQGCSETRLPARISGKPAAHDFLQCLQTQVNPAYCAIN